MFWCSVQIVLIVLSVGLINLHNISSRKFHVISLFPKENLKCCCSLRCVPIVLELGEHCRKQSHATSSNLDDKKPPNFNKVHLPNKFKKYLPPSIYGLLYFFFWRTADGKDGTKLGEKQNLYSHSVISDDK